MRSRTELSDGEIAAWRAAVAYFQAAFVCVPGLAEAVAANEKDTAEAFARVRTERDSRRLVARIIRHLIEPAPFAKKLRLMDAVPALSVVVVDRLSAIMGDAVAGPDGVIDRRGGVIAELVPGVDVAIAAALDALRNVYAHRLLRHVVRATHTQYLVEAPDWRMIQVPGGIDGLARLLDGHHGHAADYHDALRALAVFELRGPRVRGRGLVSYVERHGRDGRRRTLELIAGPMLMPGYVSSLPSADPGRKLVPLPTWPALPARARDIGGALTFQIRLICHIREHARAYVTDDGIELSADARWRMAEGLLSPGAERAVFTAFVEGRGDARPWLRRVAGDRYRLHAETEHLAIVESGELDAARSRSGTRSAAKRRRRLGG